MFEPCHDSTRYRILKDRLGRNRNFKLAKTESAHREGKIMRNRRLLFVAILSSIASLLLYLTMFRSSPYFTDASPSDPQMMGGGMGNRGGMQGMMHQRMRDNIPPGVRPQDLPEPDSRGAGLTVRYCMQCHNLASPSMHTAKEWKVIADRMFKEMSITSTRGMMRTNVSIPSVRGQKEILAYLQAHALKSLSPGTLHSGNSTGAAAFRSSCSECHALPDPKLYNAHGWDAVIRKMQSYAKQMNKKEITDQQAKEIEAFLAGHARH